MTDTTKEKSSAMSKRSNTTESGKAATATSPAPAEVENDDLEIDMPDMGEWTERVLETLPADGSPVTPFAIARDLGETSPNGIWLVKECLDDLEAAGSVHPEPNELFWRRKVAA